MEKYLNDLLKKLSASVDGDATKKRIKQALDDLTSNVTKGVQIIGAQLEQKKASAASAATSAAAATSRSSKDKKGIVKISIDHVRELGTFIFGEFHKQAARLLKKAGIKVGGKSGKSGKSGKRGMSGGSGMVMSSEYYGIDSAQYGAAGGEVSGVETWNAGGELAAAFGAADAVTDGALFPATVAGGDARAAIPATFGGGAANLFPPIPIKYIRELVPAGYTIGTGALKALQAILLKETKTMMAALLKGNKSRVISKEKVDMLFEGRMASLFAA